MDERDRQDAADALELLDQIAAHAGERFDDKHGYGAIAAARRLLRHWLDKDGKPYPFPRFWPKGL